MAIAVRAGPRQRDDRAGRQPRRHPVGRDDRRRSSWPSTSRRSRTRARSPRPDHRRVVAGVAFVLRQQRVANPLYDLKIASRRVFWVAACAGIIVFGSLMGAMFIGQQYLQNVLGVHDPAGGRRDHPGGPGHGHRGAPLGQARRGARRPVHAAPRLRVRACSGSSRCSLLWGEGSPYWQVALGYAFVGIGVGFAGTPASHSLTGSVPVTRAGMASGTADLQRDLGGAFMQSIFGALLTAGYAAAVSAAMAARAERRPDHGQRPGAADEVVQQRRGRRRAVPAVRGGHHGRRQDLVPRRRRLGLRRRHHRGADRRGRSCSSFFPKRDDEQRLLAEYHAQDTAALPST